MNLNEVFFIIYYECCFLLIKIGYFFDKFLEKNFMSIVRITRGQIGGIFFLNIHLHKSVIKDPFKQSKFSIKNLIKIFLDQVLWFFKPASKTLSKNFDELWRNRNPSYYSKNFDGLWWELTNQNIFSQSRSNSAIFVCLWIYCRKVIWDKNFDRVNRI
jgi:hypothetical protein